MLTSLQLWPSPVGAGAGQGSVYVTGLGSFGRVSLTTLSIERNTFLGLRKRLELNVVITACRLGEAGQLGNHLALGESEAQKGTVKPGEFGLDPTPLGPQWT